MEWCHFYKDKDWGKTVVLPSFFPMINLSCKISDPYSLIDDEMVKERGEALHLSLSCSKYNNVSAAYVYIWPINMFMLKMLFSCCPNACLDWWCNNRKGRRKWKVPVCCYVWCCALEAMCICRKVSKTILLMAMMKRVLSSLKIPMIQ